MDTFDCALVCVTQQKNCEHLIRHAAHHLSENGTLHVLHISTRSFNFFDNIREGEALEYLFVTAKSVGAELTIINAAQIPETVAQFAEHEGCQCVFIGVPKDKSQPAFQNRLEKLLHESDIQIVSVASESSEVSSTTNRR